MQGRSRFGWVLTGLLAAGPVGSVLSATPAVVPPPAAVPTAEGAAFFESKVRPVLVAKCFACHSEASKPVQGGLKLDTREGLLTGGVRGTSLVPGDPEHSPLIRAINGADKDLRMPPVGKLQPAEVAALTAWVKMGAPWPAAGSRGLGVGGQGKTETPKLHWAFVAPKPAPLPAVKNEGWVRNPIDRFVLAGLAAKGLSPAPPADARTLIRRATFDLTGLPPTPEEVAAFVQEVEAERAFHHRDTETRRVRDRGNERKRGGSEKFAAVAAPPPIPAPRSPAPARDAYRKLIDRLLASPAYGERWGRHWLDVARYADSNGLDENLVYNNAWRYRDYVIRAFNQDKPIDRFIQEQIAGDLLVQEQMGKSGTGEIGARGASFPRSPSSSIDPLDPIIATGFLSVGPKMLAEDDPVKQQEDIIDEQIDTLGRTFMGLTLGCARCHDHKFDPFPQTDYYALAGIFKSTKTMVNFKVVAEWQEVPLISAAEREKLAAVEEGVAAKRAEQAKRRESAGAEVLEQARKNAAGYLQAARELLKPAAATPELQPVPAPNGGAVPSTSMLIEAEDFVRGNVLKDRQGYGKDIGVLVNAGQYPNFTEYEVTVPAAGAYQLDLRYASGDARPVLVLVNGTLLASNAAGRVTGGFFPDRQQWHAEGVFRLQAGKNVVRLERASYFPHIDKLALTPFGGKSYPRTAEQTAAEAGLVPELLAQAVEQLKGGARDVSFTLPAQPDHLLPAPVQAELKRLDEEVAALEKTKPAAPRAMAVSEDKPATMRVHLRGDYQNLGRECPRGFPAILAGERPEPIAPERSGRLELARWMTRPEHPLTSRVFVNRVWRWHFGRGIVPSTDNFGKLGELPVNQPLLDWLATAFSGVPGSRLRAPGSPATKSNAEPGTQNPELNWSLKDLHRLIMLSNTYQMSSRYDAKAAAVDPENRLQWRHERQRLGAEAIRDGLLAVSEQLDRTAGGSLLKFKDREYVTSTANADPVTYVSLRRAVYLPVIRSALYDVFTAFDFGDPSVLNGDRPTTTVAPQALFMMNSSLVLEATKSMATRLLAAPEASDAARVTRAYERCYGRPPTAVETQKALAFLERLQQAYAAKEPDAAQRRLRAWQSLCKALVSANEFVYVD